MDGISESKSEIRFVGLRQSESTHLLFNSQPFATKLAKTFSAWVLVIGDVREFTSRRAAREEMEYEPFGASMICST